MGHPNIESAHSCKAVWFLLKNRVGMGQQNWKTGGDPYMTTLWFSNAFHFIVESKIIKSNANFFQLIGTLLVPFALTCKNSTFEKMGNCLDCLSPQPEVENPDPVSINVVADLTVQWIRTMHIVWKFFYAYAKVRT